MVLKGKALPCCSNKPSFGNMCVPGGIWLMGINDVTKYLYDAVNKSMYKIMYILTLRSHYLFAHIHTNYNYFDTRKTVDTHQKSSCL